MKKTASETWPRLTEERIKLPWLKIDFDKFMVEGESEEEASNSQGVRLKGGGEEGVRLKGGGGRGGMHMIIGENETTGGIVGRPVKDLPATDVVFVVVSDRAQW